MSDFIIIAGVAIVPALAFGVAIYLSATRRTEPDPPTFRCPLWPGCNCPDGTMHPDCPGLEDLKKGQPQ